MRILISIALLLLVVCLPEAGAAQTSAESFNAKQVQFLYTHYLRAAFYAACNDIKPALTEFNTVKRVDKDSVQVRLRSAALLLKNGDVNKARVQLNEARKYDPNNIDVSLSLIFLYSYLQDDAALEAEYGGFLEQAYNLKPENIKIAEYLGQFYFYQNRVNDAIKVYEAITEVNPEYVEGMFWLGYLYAESGDKDNAIAIWMKVLEREKDHAPTLNSLGYVYAEGGIKLDEAETMIKRAIEKEPQNGAYMDSLGWLYFKKKQYEKADEYLNKALILLKDPVVYEHLGDVWMAAKDLKKAVNYYQEGIKYFPDDKNLQEKLKQYGTKNTTD